VGAVPDIATQQGRRRSGSHGVSSMSSIFFNECDSYHLLRVFAAANCRTSGLGHHAFQLTRPDRESNW
jgi:hypothetical protein